MAILKVRFGQHENVVLMEVLEQAHCLCGKGKLAEVGGLQLWSVELPDMARDDVWIRGTRGDRNNARCQLTCESPAAAADYIRRAKELIETADLSGFAGEDEAVDTVPDESKEIVWETVEPKALSKSNGPQALSGVEGSAT